ncbi:hypothetical protein [Aestuariivivens marinum]|uniref:hypothetical protein n=1 Tax=Aestuariivivens marinum TaxID=2913555 RepID=UPI001F588A22|nr:hypothetical protein [Aestuariivivens marinum]
MKTLRLLLVISGVLFLITACELNEDPIIEDNFIESNFQSKTAKQKELPYKAKMFTRPAEGTPTGDCPSANSPTNFWRPEHQVGNGNATHLGNFTTDLKFCFHIVLNEQGMPDFANGMGEFTGGASAIEANNGDLLYTKGRGSQVMPIQDDIYILEFFHVVDITGGTGRFENASGQFVNHGMVRADGTGTDHTQEGIIILK